MSQPLILSDTGAAYLIDWIRGFLQWNKYYFLLDQ